MGLSQVWVGPREMAQHGKVHCQTSQPEFQSWTHLVERENQLRRPYLSLMIEWVLLSTSGEYSTLCWSYCVVKACHSLLFLEAKWNWEEQRLYIPARMCCHGLRSPTSIKPGLPQVLAFPNITILETKTCTWTFGIQPSSGSHPGIKWDD